ncbi:MAG TPA: hypothetical protein VM869_05450, partial [Enhygromyxa sp.]|nr:hypothetical protein [Enhygromyxa sp.]
MVVRINGLFVSSVVLALASIGCGDDRSSEATSETTSDTSSESADQAGDGDGDPSTGDGDGDGIKFDMAMLPDSGGGSCQGMGGDDVEFSYIWVANSAEGTLSKINTQTLEEEGRYITRPD